MTETIKVPVKVVDGAKWAELSALGRSVTHLVCGEKVDCKDENYSFQGGHRVRLFGFKKNVHWRIPEGLTLDIADVAPADAPRRQNTQRHAKR